MKLATFQFKDQQWTVKSFPKWDSPNTLILIFAAPQFADNPEPITTLTKAYPTAKIIGCSSAGEINGISVQDDTLSVAVIAFEKTPLEVVSLPINSTQDSFNIGIALAKQLDKPNLRGIFVLSDGLSINGSELAKGLNILNKSDITITGGLAGDGSAFKKTWVIYKGKLLSEHIVAVGFYGEHIKLTQSSGGGWDIFGPERLVSRSKNNILYELDGRPALALYKEYLGDKASGLPATGLLFPLSIRKDDNDKNPLVRTILAVDEATQSLTFAGDIPQGYRAQLMRANFDRLIGGASNAGKLAATPSDLGPQLLIAISCIGRRLLLGERAEEETESTLESFPQGTQQVGFYSYGELSSRKVGSCDLHNQTMTLTSVAEEA